MGTEVEFEVLSPEGWRRQQPVGSEAAVAAKSGNGKYPPPLTTLDGTTIAQLWDYRFRGDEIFAHLRDEIASRYRDVGFIDYDVFGNVHGHQETQILATLPEKLAELGCDAVLSGIGA